MENYIPITSYELAKGMKDPELRILAVHKMPRGEGKFIVSVEAINSAAYVWIETPESGEWSDNGFMWFVETSGKKETKKLIFTPRSKRLTAA